MELTATSILAENLIKWYGDRMEEEEDFF